MTKKTGTGTEEMGLEEYLDRYVGNRKPAGKKTAGKKRQPRPPGWTPERQYACIPMPAFGKARPRGTLASKKMYMPKAYTEKRDLFRQLFGALTVSPPVILAVTAVRQMPKGWSKKKKRLRDGTYTTTTPDVDNIIGAVMDAILDDDSGVVSSSSTKIWGYENEIRIMLLEVDELDVWEGEP